MGYSSAHIPRDTKAFVRCAADAGAELKLQQAVGLANEQQQLVLVEQVIARHGADPGGRCFSQWCRHLNPMTDDMLGAPLRIVVAATLGHSAKARAISLAATSKERKLLGERPELVSLDGTRKTPSSADLRLNTTDREEWKSPRLRRLPWTLLSAGHVQWPRPIQAGADVRATRRMPRHRPRKA